MATPNLSYQNFFTTTLSSSIVAGDTTIPLVSVPTPSEGYLVIEPDSSTAREIIYYTSKGASFVTCPSASAGRGVGGTTAASHASGATVQMNNNAEMWTAIQDGSANTGMHQWFNDSFQDYVQTGGTVASATGLIASISSGVTYINGRRLTFNAMSKTFTASKDTYVDLVAPSSADNIATVSYTEVASGVSAGINPVSNGIHIAKVNTGASTIGTISQGGILEVVDRLGNYIYNPSPITKVLGYVESTAGSGTFTTAETTMLTMNAVNVPLTTYVRVTVKIHFGSTVDGDYVEVYLKQDGTTIETTRVVANASGKWAVCQFSTIVKTTSGVHNYSASAARVVGTGTINAAGSSAAKYWLMAEVL